MGNPWPQDRVAVIGKLIVVICAVLSASAALAAQDLDAIRANLNSGNSELVRNALFQIRNLRSEEASRLATPFLNDRDEVVRATAIGSVAFLPKQEAARLLLPLLNDKAEFVRQETAFALGEVADVSVTASLLGRLRNDSELSVRSASAVALGKIGDPTAVDGLTAIFKTKPSEDNEFLHRSAAKSIGRIAESMRGDRSGSPTPQNFLPSKFKETFVGDPSPAFRAAVGILQKVLQSDKETDDTRREAAFALGAIGDKTSIPVLQRYLNASDRYLAEISKEALLRLGVPQ